MSKENNRAARRFHRARIAKKRRHYWANVVKRNPDRVGRIVNSPKCCSCFMCGNQRYWYGRPIQERRYDPVEMYEMVEVNFISKTRRITFHVRY